MNRNELLSLRKALWNRVDRLRKIGDHSAEAPDVRANAEAILLLLDHALETSKDDDDVG